MSFLNDGWPRCSHVAKNKTCSVDKKGKDEHGRGSGRIRESVGLMFFKMDGGWHECF